MLPADLNAVVAANLARVQERIAAACEKAGRPANDVRLVGVSKYVGIEETLALLRAGCNRLGEARPQQLCEKREAPEFEEHPVNWRLIGHLQRNKVKRLLDAGVCNLDSVDSRRLLEAINASMEGRGRKMPILLEVNISGDVEKHGFSPSDISAVIAELDQFPNVEVQGLMGMAAREGGEETARRNFAALRDLRDRLATPKLPLAELSMGMSGDLEAAILEGSTLVRVGSALWEGIQ